MAGLLPLQLGLPKEVTGSSKPSAWVPVNIWHDSNGNPDSKNTKEYEHPQSWLEPDRYIRSRAKDPKINSVYVRDVKMVRVDETKNRSLLVTWSFYECFKRHFMQVNGTVETWSSVDKYELKFTYYMQVAGKSMSFVDGDVKTTNELRYIYTPPEEATKVVVSIRPVSKKNSYNKDIDFWVGGYSQKEYNPECVYTFDTSNQAGAPLSIPDAEYTSVNGEYGISVRVSVTDTNTHEVDFQVTKQNVAPDDSSYESVTVKNGAAAFFFAIGSKYVNYGSSYVIRCRPVSKGRNILGKWSEFTTPIQVAPATPNDKAGHRLKAASSGVNAITLTWEQGPGATSYEIAYTENLNALWDRENNVYLDSDALSTVTTESLKYVFTSLDENKRYWFAIRSVNDAGNSPWVPSIGPRACGAAKRPEPPSIWASKYSMGASGDYVYLYWQHNALDDSEQNAAIIEIYQNGYTSTKTPTTIRIDGDTAYKQIKSADISGAQKFDFRVRTWGGVTNLAGEEQYWSNWSELKTVKVHAAPSATLTSSSISNGKLSKMPLSVHIVSSPTAEVDTFVRLEILTKDATTIHDRYGNTTAVNAGTIIYSKDLTVKSSSTYDYTITAGGVDLDPVTYTLRATVMKESGLTATASLNFKPTWSEDAPEPEATFTINNKKLTEYIQPFCRDANYNLITSNIQFTVYRINIDGTLTLLGTKPVKENGYADKIYDPHPTFGEVQYRVVANYLNNGAVTYSDFAVNGPTCNRCVIQWNNERDVYFDDEEDAENSSWEGNILELPFNLDIDEKTNRDITFADYAGRSQPVSYYGTKIGTTSTWKMTVPKSSRMLNKLRYLATYMGDLYVREPSGLGYWAAINISIGQTHNSPGCPVSLDVTRVEGPK